MEENMTCERCGSDAEEYQFGDEWCHDCWYEVHVLGWGENYENVLPPAGVTGW